MPITEKELRDAVRRILTASAEMHSARLYEEMGIERGAARIDFALAGVNLEGFELKSDLDSLARMHNQIHAYNRVFDRITLAAGAAFLDEVAAIIPIWWGVWRANRIEDGSLAIEEVRPAAQNPAQEPYSVATLLWRDEAVAALVDASDQPPLRASRSELYERMVERMPLERLRSCVVRKLVERDVTKVVKPSTPGGGWSRLVANC